MIGDHTGTVHKTSIDAIDARLAPCLSKIHSIRVMKSSVMYEGLMELGYIDTCIHPFLFIFRAMTALADRFVS